MIVAVVGRKGGVGKTTTAVSLAAAFALLGRRALVVDLDSQASASRSLGVGRADLAPSSYDVLFRALPVEGAVRAVGERLDLLTGSADLVHADLDLAPLRRREERLTECLAPVATTYDWIFLDCPPALGALAANALVAAEAFLVPISPQPLAFDGVDVVLETAERLRGRFGRPARFLGLLLTMVDRRTRAATIHAAEIRLRYGLHVLDAEIPINVKLAEAPSVGRTIFAFDPKASGAHAYRVAAVELAERCGFSDEAGAVAAGSAAGSAPEPAPPDAAALRL